MNIVFANIISVLHFCIFLFITLCCLLIPLGYKLKWNWVKIRKLRLLHVIMMGFITIETILGIVCPLTSLEIFLRDENKVGNILNKIIHEIMYWDLPASYFIIIYVLCFLYLIFLWIYFKPYNKKYTNLNN